MTADSSIRLSVCLNSRNEEKNLPRALCSVRGLADEIVLADTGSTDRTLLQYLTELSPEQLPHGLTSERVLELGQRWFPASAPLMWLRAQRALDGGDFAEAEGLLRRLVGMGRDHSYDRHFSFDPRIVGEDAMLNLGTCLVRMCKLVDPLSLKLVHFGVKTVFRFEVVRLGTIIRTV